MRRSSLAVTTCAIAFTMGCGGRTNPQRQAPDDGPSCDAQTQCVAEVCQQATSCRDDDADIWCTFANAPNGTFCDLPASPPGTEDGVCAQGLCFDRGPIACESDSECGTVRYCVAGACALPGQVGDYCESDDCADGLACDDERGYCVASIGGECVTNSHCQFTCIAGECGVAGGLLAACDSGDDDDCARPLGCRPQANVCAQQSGASCTQNNECLATCIGGVCSEPAGRGDTCDSGDPEDCAEGLACDVDSGLCLLGLGQPCGGDGECAERCVDLVCAPPRTHHESCMPGDCAQDLVCNLESLTCLWDVGLACSDNSQCDQACVNGVCAPASDLGGVCDSGEDADCANDLLCPSGVCVRDNGLACNDDAQCVGACLVNICGDPQADGESCADDADCTSTCLIDTCGQPAADGALCEDDGDCADSPCNHDTCGTPGFQVFVFEVQGHYASNCATLTELEFFENDTLISGVTTGALDVYDSVRNGLSGYWGSGTWGGENLLDGETAYSSANSTVFLFNSTEPGPDEWARLALFVPDTNEVTRIVVHLGSSQGRIPYYVRVYRADPYDFDAQLTQRSDEGLTLLWTITPDATWTAVQAETLDL